MYFQRLNLFLQNCYYVFNKFQSRQCRDRCRDSETDVIISPYTPNKVKAAPWDDINFSF